MCYNKTIMIFNALVKVFIRDKHNCVFGYDWQTLKAAILDMFFSKRVERRGSIGMGSSTHE